MKVSEITSKDNEKIKKLKKLSMKKYRQEFSEYMIENATILLDALRSGFKPTSLFVTQDFIDHDSERWDEIEQGCGLDEYYLIDEKVNKAFSELDTPAGIAAVYRNDGLQSVSDKLKFTDSTRIVYLNAISDPGNLGTILRSALAFEITTVVVDPSCVDVYNPKTVQAARGAIFNLDIIQDDPDRTILKQIKKQIPIVTTALDGAGTLKGSATLHEDKFCLVFGNEAHGISDDVRKLSNELIKIEMSDKIESLNVAASASIIFHHIFSQG
jgi:RNA methyltransferase, TrmH family